jgi:hypothetical protein
MIYFVKNLFLTKYIIEVENFLKSKIIFWVHRSLKINIVLNF